jgi:uncharacterized membrane protein YebE (DUF533 family)
MEASMKKALFIIIAVSFLGTISFAQTQSPQMNKTQKKQVERMKEGVNKGELTKNEAKVLVKEQKHIRKEKTAAKADGKLTKAERKHIKKDLAKATKDIAEKKHNTKGQNN